MITNVDHIPLDETNTALQAWRLMKERYRLPGGIHICLDKEIPVEAGLAGGSTDAAAIIKAVNRMYDLRLTHAELTKLGSQIGADVPFCVLGGTALAEGIGEILTPLPSLPRIWLVLVNPGFGVSTAGIYRGLRWESITRHPDIDLMVQAAKNKDWGKISINMINVLEEVTLNMYPEIGVIKEELAKIGLCSLMSGSGPTVFGLADTHEKAIKAAEKIKSRWKTVIVAHTI